MLSAVLNFHPAPPNKILPSVSSLLLPCHIHQWICCLDVAARLRNVIQHSRCLVVLLLWLNTHLKGSSEHFNVFQSCQCISLKKNLISLDYTQRFQRFCRETFLNWCLCLSVRRYWVDGQDICLICAFVWCVCWDWKFSVLISVKFVHVGPP